MKRTRRNCPSRMHTGNSHDVIDAVSLGADSVEHGSFIDEIPDATIAEMKSKGIAFDPTLSVVEGFTQLCPRRHHVAQAFARSAGHAEGFDRRNRTCRHGRSK